MSYFTSFVLRNVSEFCEACAQSLWCRRKLCETCSMISNGRLIPEIVLVLVDAFDAGSVLSFNVAMNKPELHDRGG